MNPVKAGLVKLPHLYPWSSCRFFQRDRDYPAWLDRESLLAFFRDEHHDPYRSFWESISEALRDKDFFNKMARWEHRIENDLRQIKADEREAALDILADVCELFGLPDLMVEGARSTGRLLEARQAFISRAKDETDISLRMIGELAGGISAQAVSNMYRKIRLTEGTVPSVNRPR
jgi:hypothetical protein